MAGNSILSFLQVLIFLNNKKTFVGSRTSAVEAARLYDKFAIQNQGLQVYSYHLHLKAKTNFSYNQREILEILKENMHYGQ